MKRFLLVALAAVSLMACKKDEATPSTPQATGLLARLPGSWKPVYVSYSLQTPLFPDPIEGESFDPTGQFTFTRNPENFNYSIAFLANFNGFPFPLNLNGNGQWTATYNERYLVLTQNTQDQFFEVLVNEPNLQRWEGTLFVTLPPPISQTLPVEVEIELQRIN